MAKFYFKLDTAGVRELMKSPEMQEILQSEARATAGQYGADTDVDIYVGPNRANSMVYQRKGDFTNDLLKALGRAKND